MRIFILIFHFEWIVIFHVYRMAILRQNFPLNCTSSPTRQSKGGIWWDPRLTWEAVHRSSSSLCPAVFSFLVVSAFPAIWQHWQLTGPPLHTGSVGSNPTISFFKLWLGFPWGAHRGGNSDLQVSHDCQRWGRGIKGTGGSAQLRESLPSAVVGTTAMVEVEGKRTPTKWSCGVFWSLCGPHSRGKD